MQPCHLPLAHISLEGMGDFLSNDLFWVIRGAVVGGQHRLAQLYMRLVMVCHSEDIRDLSNVGLTKTSFQDYVTVDMVALGQVGGDREVEERWEKTKGMMDSSASCNCPGRGGFVLHVAIVALVALDCVQRIAGDRRELERPRGEGK